MYLISNYSGEHSDTDHYWVVAKIRERLTVSKQTDLTFNLKKSNEIEGKEPYWFETSNMCRALGNSDAGMDTIK